MIFKKPYAFIIKHFKLIHLVMLACLVFFNLTLNDLHNLFVSFQKSNTLTYAEANMYINKFIYFFILVVIILTAVIYWLFKEKKKPTKLYLSLIIYLVVLLPIYSYIFSVLNKMIDNLISIDTILVCRDLALIASIPGYIFIIICFIRGIGFNLKQFNFSKDLKELEIEEKDSEEIEVTFGQNSYKYKRYIRRSLREIKYYIFENKFAIFCIGALILIILSISGINYYLKYSRSLNQKDAAIVDGIAYTIKNSYVTTKDSTGNIINPDNNYIVIEFTFYNATTINRIIDLDLITLSVGKLNYQPTLIMNGKFYDLGIPYNKGTIIKPMESLDSTITFEVPKKLNLNNIKLKVRYGIENKVDKVISQYKIFDVNPQKIDEDRSTYGFQMNEQININPIGINKLDLTFTGYKLVDSFENKYVTCTNEKCFPMSEVIKPDNKEINTMMVLSYDSKIYEDNQFTKSLNTYNKIFENYLKVNYKILNREYQVSAKVVNKSDIENKIFLILDRKVLKADFIELELNFRNDTYKIKLLN